MKGPEGAPVPGERWEKIEALFAEAKALPPAKQRASSRPRCAGDQVLQEEVERLLRSHDQPGSFMQAPAIHLLQSEIGGKPPTMTVPPVSGIGIRCPFCRAENEE